MVSKEVILKRAEALEAKAEAQRVLRERETAPANPNHT
jgi:hypothetical protein